MTIRAKIPRQNQTTPYSVGATGQKSEMHDEYKYKDERTYHAALLDSYRTGELEILWQGLQRIPRR